MTLFKSYLDNEIDALQSGGTGGAGIQLSSGLAGANFPWLTVAGGDIVYGYGTVTYLWTPGAGDGVNTSVGLVSAPISGVPINLGMLISNFTGDEKIVVFDISAVTVDTPDVLIHHALTGAAVIVVQVGTDLSFNENDGIVSAAGGSFIVQAIVSITND